VKGKCGPHFVVDKEQPFFFRGSNQGKKLFSEATLFKNSKKLTDEAKTKMQQYITKHSNV
jgi:hypothetical protein